MHGKLLTIKYLNARHAAAYFTSNEIPCLYKMYSLNEILTVFDKNSNQHYTHQLIRRSVCSGLDMIFGNALNDFNLDSRQHERSVALGS